MEKFTIIEQKYRERIEEIKKKFYFTVLDEDFIIINETLKEIQKEIKKLYKLKHIQPNERIIKK